MEKLDLDFRDLNILFNSKEESFEEFCCHLAYEFDKVPKTGSRYFRFRGAGGDGGVECIWELPNGKVWGWQSKYVFDFKKLKSQLYESVKTVLNNYPNLEKYFICIPFNLTGKTGRGKGQKDKFDEWIEDWKKLAEERGIEVDFIPWDKTILLNRLLSNKNAEAKIKFWFSLNTLDEKWFNEHIDKSVSIAGVRYNPQLSIKTPIYKQLKCFERDCNEELKDYLKKLNELKTNWSKLLENKTLDASPKPSKKTLEIAKDVYSLMEDLYSYTVETEIQAINVEDIFDSLLKLLNQLKEDFSNDLQKVYSKEWGDFVAENPNFRQWMAEYQASFPTANYDLAKESLELLEELKNWVINHYSLSKEKFLLIKGEAGIGKTHTILDFARYRLKNGAKSIVLFGEYFNGNEEPWGQILKVLGIDKYFSKDEFLEALNIWGHITQKPVIIFIDALNETKPFGYWAKHIKFITEDIKKYKWLKLCVSCRSTYLEGCLPEDLKIRTIEHEGFKGIEFNALTEFLKFYKLPSPTIPILNPEFANPLFLKIFFDTLDKKKVLSFPEESLSFSEIMDAYLKKKEEKIANALNYNPKRKITLKTLNKILEEIKNSKTQWIPWEKADEICQELWEGKERDTSLLEKLVQEGLLREDRANEEDVVLIGYERLRDFILAGKYLEEYSSIEDLINSFKVGDLRFLMENVYENKGILEALSILIPEKFNVEVYEVFIDILDDYTINELFLYSIKWRKASSISEKTKERLLELLKNEEFFEKAMDLIISKLIYPNFPINANWLHSLLFSVPMSQRDSWWVLYLHISYENNSEVKKIIDWVFKIDISRTSEEVLKLWITTLTWFLASSDRRVRDRSTKALVKLLENKAEIIPEILEKFHEVDDEYILERLLGAIYGALIRNKNFKILSKISNLVYKFYFKNEENIPVNIKIRDYARLILEMALHFEVLPKDIDIDKFRPPFKSEFPKKLPSDEEILKLEKSFEKHKNKIAIKILINSMQPEHTTLRGNWYGDFGRYIFQSALRIFDLKDTSIQQLSNLAVKMIFEEFGYDINTHGRFDTYLIGKYGAGGGKPSWIERIGKKYQWIALYRIMGLVADNFDVEDRIFAPKHDLYSRKLKDIDTTILLNKIYSSRQKHTWWFSLNYNFEKTSHLPDEEWINNLDDLPNIKNSLVVKNPTNNEDYYLLIAFPDWSSRKDEDEYPYRNIWMHIRSYLVPKDKSKKFYKWLSKQDLMGRWMPEGFNLYEDFIGEYPWAIPYQKFFEVENEWQEVKNFSITEVFKSEVNLYIEILRKIMNENEEEVKDTHIQELIKKDIKYSILTQDLQKYNRKINFDKFLSVNVLATTNTLVYEKIEDASIDESLSIEVPAKFFFDKIPNLEWDGKGSYLLDGKEIFIFPNVYEEGVYALLVNKQFMDEFMKRENLELVWTILGEKQVFNNISDIKVESFSIILK